MLMYGSYSFQIDLLFNKTFPRLALCDIRANQYWNSQHMPSAIFAIVVDVADQWPS